MVLLLPFSVKNVLSFFGLLGDIQVIYGRLNDVIGLAISPIIVYIIVFSPQLCIIIIISIILWLMCLLKM